MFSSRLTNPCIYLTEQCRSNNDIFSGRTYIPSHHRQGKQKKIFAKGRPRALNAADFLPDDIIEEEIIRYQNALNNSQFRLYYLQNNPMLNPLVQGTFIQEENEPFVNVDNIPGCRISPMPEKFSGFLGGKRTSVAGCMRIGNFVKLHQLLDILPKNIEMWLYEAYREPHQPPKDSEGSAVFSSRSTGGAVDFLLFYRTPFGECFPLWEVKTNKINPKTLSVREKNIRTMINLAAICCDDYEVGFVSDPKNFGHYERNTCLYQFYTSCNQQPATYGWMTKSQMESCLIRNVEKIKQYCIEQFDYELRLRPLHNESTMPSPSCTRP